MGAARYLLDTACYVYAKHSPCRPEWRDLLRLHPYCSAPSAYGLCDRLGWYGLAECILSLATHVWSSLLPTASPTASRALVAKRAAASCSVAPRAQEDERAWFLPVLGRAYTEQVARADDMVENQDVPKACLRDKATFVGLAAILIALAVILVGTRDPRIHCFMIPSRDVEDLPLDFSWAPVVRHATSCGGYAEGYSGGLVIDARAFELYPNKSKARVAYGCWFYLARASNVLVNVRRSLRAQNRSVLAHRLGLDCRDERCYMDLADKMWCSAAIQLGYHSLMVAQSHGSRAPELIVCYGECARTSIYGACPVGIPLRAADDTDNGAACECNNASMLINCNTRAIHQCDEAARAVESVWKEACGIRSLLMGDCHLRC